MPQWLWTAGILLAIVVLFAWVLWIGGGEPLDRDDTGGGGG
jgi:hypothetical protein